MAQAGATLQVTEAGEVSSACATGSVPLVTPSGIVATPSTTSINLSWNAVTGADSYIVELCSGGNAGSAGLSDFTASSGTFVANSDGSVTKAAGSGLVLQSPAVGDLKGATISIDLKFTSTATKRLYVKLNNNESNNSNNKIGEAYDNTTSDRKTLTFTVPANSAYSTGNDYIALRFESAVAATIYSISVTPAGGGGDNTPENCNFYPSENNSITIPGLNPNTSYRYRVKAVREIESSQETESSAYSTAATTKTLPTGTAINEWTTDNSYTVFQQGNDLVVRGGEVKSLEVYSISGACIARAENTESINLAQLSSGALIVRINEKTVKKIIWKQ